MKTFTKEFKEALSQLSHKEKDRLIIRLLKKDDILAHRLFFELVDTSTMEERRALIKEHIIEEAAQMTEDYYRINYLNSDIRTLSAYITRHVRITKDKYGEASLNLLLLNEALRLNRENILNERPSEKLRKFCVGIIARAFKILLLIDKMHEDLLLDFEDDLKVLGLLIGHNDLLMRTAIRNGLDVNWLIQGTIPEDLVSRHKEIKQNGFLR